jgi:hypothetical protein
MTSTASVADDKLQGLKAQWLDKLWLHLFDGDGGGLMSPGQIRREHRNRDDVRRAEMAAIMEAEQEVNSIHKGLKTIDENGNLIDTPKPEQISTHLIIENTAVEQNLDIGLDTAAIMLKSVVKEVGVRDLERSLNTRRMAIQAETEIIASPPVIVSSKPVNPEWIRQWRILSQDVFHLQQQALWARLLIREIAQPGKYAIGLLNALRQLNNDDIDSTAIVAKYSLGEFIYNASGSYFQADYHDQLFYTLEDIGLIAGGLDDDQHKTLKSTEADRFYHLLISGNKGLEVTAPDHRLTLSLPVIKLSRIGRQLIDLFTGESDMAYLFDLARTIKEQGFEVTLGGWDSEAGARGQFTAKIPL